MIPNTTARSLRPAFAAALLAATSAWASPGDVGVEWRLTVPEGTPTVYITGSLPEFGPWNPKKTAMRGDGNVRTYTTMLRPGTGIEYKFTLGDWRSEMRNADGTVPDNFKADAGPQGRTLEHAAPSFGPRDADLPGVTGTVAKLGEFDSRFLVYPRDVWVWLPEQYEKEPLRRFPVLYMHDGQNCFDPALSYTGIDWGADETLTKLIAEGVVPPMIVVCVANTPGRIVEYDPEGLGPEYARFLVEELKPAIDKKFRTLDGPENTAAMGSSMGGLISLYLGAEHSDVFGRVGCLATHFPFSGGSYLNALIARGEYPRNVRVYVDYGTKDTDAPYEPYAEWFRHTMTGWGWCDGSDFAVLKFDGSGHSEGAWRERLHVPMTFLFGGDR